MHNDISRSLTSGRETVFWGKRMTLVLLTSFVRQLSESHIAGLTHVVRKTFIIPIQKAHIFSKKKLTTIPFDDIIVFVGLAKY